MADNDLDKYLENLGISTQEEDDAEPELIPEETAETTAFVPSVAQGNMQERLESFLVNLLLNFDPAYAVDISAAEDEEIFVDIYGGDPGKIIGRNGRTLQALEFITNTVINRDEEGRVRVNIDVGGYKRRRDDRLKNTARQAAAKVRKTGFAVELETMNAAERRVIHMEIAEDPTVVSESSGEGRDRRVVVKPS